MASNNKEVLETQVLMSILLEDFDLSEEDMIITEALRDSDVSDLIKIADIGKEGANKEADATSDEISALLNIDRVIDKIEADELAASGYNDSNNTINVNLNDSPEDTINVTMTDKSTDPNDVTVQLKDTDDIDSTVGNIHTLNVALTDKVPNSTTDTSSTDSNDDNTKEITLRLNNKSNDYDPINAAIDKLESEDSEDIISVKLTDKPSTDSDIKVSLKDSAASSSNDKDDDGGEDTIHINLTDKREQVIRDKEELFITRRNELMANPDPNLQLSVCIKVVIQLRDSLERLINHIPNETTLVKTKYVIGDILENILSNSNIILKDPKRMKQVVYNVFDLLISLNKYIYTKFTDIESEVNDSSKSTEDADIAKQITDVEKNEQDPSSDDDNSNQINNTVIRPLDKEVKKTPNVNKKKF